MYKRQAQTSEDTQARPPSFEANRFTKTKGPNIHVADLPRRGVGEVVVLNVTPTASSATVSYTHLDVYKRQHQDCSQGHMHLG